jgi:hypothetical protein
MNDDNDDDDDDDDDVSSMRCVCLRVMKSIMQLQYQEYYLMDIDS